MGFAAFLRNLIGAASRDDLDAARVAASSASDARLAAQDARQLVLRSKEEHDLVITRVEDELSRLSARVEAMPAMREQLETFVQSLESAIAQLVAAADRTQALLRDVEERKVRTANAVWMAITAAGIAVVCAVISALR